MTVHIWIYTFTALSHHINI